MPAPTGPQYFSVAKHLVFISHSGADTWVARQISRECECVGADTFLDEVEIAVGEDSETAIPASLKVASELLVLITPWAIDRPYVWIEIGAAWLRQIPLIVVLHGISTEDFQENPKAPVLLKRRNLIDINELDRYFEQLVTRLEATAAN